MEFEQFSKIVERVYKADRECSLYLKSIPTDVRSAFYDNHYVETIQKTTDFLLKELLSVELYYDVTWFIYEVDESRELTSHNLKTANGAKYYINSLESFLSYCSVEHFGSEV